jgi:hypothetical protein
VINWENFRLKDGTIDLIAAYDSQIVRRVDDAEKIKKDHMYLLDLMEECSIRRIKAAVIAVDCVIRK